MEQAQRTLTHSSRTTKYNHNFQLIKTKTHDTKPNPEQQPPHFNSYASDNDSRYDYVSQSKRRQSDFRQKSHSYRVRKSVGSKNTRKSQDGRTIHEIFNIRNKNNTDSKSYQASAPIKYTLNNQNIDNVSIDNKTFSSKSEAGFIENKNNILSTDKKITQPQLPPATPDRQTHRYRNNDESSQRSIESRSRYRQIRSLNTINIRKNRPLYFQKQWNMNQPVKTQHNAQSRIGSIKKQQISKQTPLDPSKPQDIAHIIQKTSKILLQKIPQQQLEQQTILRSTIHTSHKKRKVNNNQMLCDKQLINRLNLRTKYYRFKHNQRIKEKFQEESYKINSINNYMTANSANSHSDNIFSHQKYYLSKNPSFGKIHQIQFTHNSKVQDIVKGIHHTNQNRLVISIKVPKIFHSTPDLLLPLQQLKFKAVMIFQEFGIMRPGLICQRQEIKVMKHPESLTFVYDCQANNKGSQQDQILDKYRKSGKFCINWYTDGSVYMGQLENDYRQGLALQWVPGAYVYFGQYEQNFRHGYGVMKYNNKQVYIGVWAYDYYHGYGKLLDQEGYVIKQGVFRNSQIKTQGEYNQLS